MLLKFCSLARPDNIFSLLNSWLGLPCLVLVITCDPVNSSHLAGGRRGLDKLMFESSGSLAVRPRGCLLHHISVQSILKYSNTKNDQSLRPPSSPDIAFSFTLFPKSIRHLHLRQVVTWRRLRIMKQWMLRVERKL